MNLSYRVQSSKIGTKLYVSRVLTNTLATSRWNMNANLRSCDINSIFSNETGDLMIVGQWKGNAEWRSCALTLALLTKMRSAFHFCLQYITFCVVVTL